VHVHQFVQVESWASDNLNFANMHVMQRVDTLACLLDISGDGVRDKFVDNILEVCGADFPLDDIDHLLPDVPNLLTLSITGLLGGHVLIIIA